MDKRELKRQYKEAEIPAGVYRVLNTQSDRSLVGSSVNVNAILNRHRTELRAGSHRNRELQHDWNAFGEEAFRFEVLDTITPQDKPGYDVKSELSVLEELWLERLSPYGARGYNDQPT
jgi:hypothetical protein